MSKHRKHPRSEHGDGDEGRPKRLARKQYEAELEKLQAELVHLQQWVVATGAKVCVVFEGRDGAGKGGVIKRITERVSPRVFRVVALPAPTEREKSQMYVQRYVPHFPAAGEVVIFDRSPGTTVPASNGSWGSAARTRSQRFLRMVPAVETGHGRLRDHPGEVLARHRAGRADPQARRPASTTGARPGSCRRWTSKSYSRWYDYSRARDDMFAATDTDWAPWYVADSNDKRRVRLNIIGHLLDQVPYEPAPAAPIRLPARQKPGDYAEPDRPHRRVPDRY